MKIVGVELVKGVLGKGEDVGEKYDGERCIGWGMGGKKDGKEGRY